LSGAQADGAPMPVEGGGAHPEGAEQAGAQGRNADGGSSERLARIVFALLVVGCFAALLITQRLKHTPTLVQEPKLTHVIAPASSGESREEHIAFKLAKADRVTVVVESSSDEVVATLVRDLPVGRYKTLSLRWNGHKGTARGYSVVRKADGYTTLVPHNHGALAPSGEYSVRVELRNEDRSVPFPHTFKLVGP
jgi:hypothetical protein